MEITTDIKLYDIIWQSKGSGPSPVPGGYRTELYFSGCAKARCGNPCPSCCNPMIWQDDKTKSLRPEEIFNEIQRKQLPKYITIVGGEPTDQINGLNALCKLLHENGYHIIVFTWHNYNWVKNNFAPKELANIDIIVTDPYEQDKRIYDFTLDDGLHNVVGSANQHICCFHDGKEFQIAAGEVNHITLNYENHLTIYAKDGRICYEQ